MPSGYSYVLFGETRPKGVPFSGFRYAGKGRDLNTNEKKNSPSVKRAKKCIALGENVLASFVIFVTVYLPQFKEIVGLQ